MSRTARLTIVLLLNLALVATLIVVGLSAHSIGVLAEGGDYFADAAAVGVSLLAIWLSKRPPTPKRPHGYPNATNIAALINGGWLLVLSILVALTSARRLLGHAPRVSGLPVLIVSGIAGLLMLIGALILGADADADAGIGAPHTNPAGAPHTNPAGAPDGDDLNIRAVLLDTAGDAAAAGGVAVAGGVIYATGGWNWLDPAIALVISLIVGTHAVILVCKVIAALGARRPGDDIDAHRRSPA